MVSSTLGQRSGDKAARDGEGRTVFSKVTSKLLVPRHIIKRHLHEGFDQNTGVAPRF
jgi:hypothetical protein